MHSILDLANQIIVNLTLNPEFTIVLKWSLNSLIIKTQSLRFVFPNKFQEIKKPEYLLY